MIGVVLSGGGTKGAFQAGVIEKLGITPDLVVGTSIGALNALVWNYKGSVELKRLWHTVESRSDWLNLNVKGLFLKGIYRTDKLKKFVGSIIESGIPRFKSYSCRVDITTGSISYISHDSSEYADSVIDSATVPVAIKPKGKYVDGGVREKIPLRFAIGAGCSEIHVIMCNPISKNPEISSIPKNPISMTLRTIDILTHESQNDDILRASRKRKIIFYAPDKMLYDTFCFDGRLIKDAFRQGLEAVGVSAEELPNRLGR